MSTAKRIPLSASNPNVVNSPMRAPSGFNGAKKVRSHADTMREEPYGQPPPAKRQMIERGIASPSRPKTTRTIAHRAATRATASTATAQKASAASLCQPTDEELTNLRTWQTQIRSRFPKMVFYFEGISDEQRSKLAKQIGRLGAHEEKFFSINITHIVTNRSVPPEKPRGEREEDPDAQGDNEHPKTIDPSLLNRTADPTRRKLVYDTPAGRKPKTRSTDVLDRARDMGKRIWSLEKLNKILELALTPNEHVSGTRSHGTTQGTSRAGKGGADLAQLLDHEREHGPSDRDPTVSRSDLVKFTGPYIYVYDLEEKTKPVMIREYRKATDPKDQDWPQFRVTSQGRCPFVLDESHDHPEKETRARTRAAKAAAAEAVEPAAPKPKASDIPLKVSTGKRTLAQMEDGHNRGAAGIRATESFDRSKIANPPSLEFRSQNAFISHAKAGRFLAGEPVASGLQPSNVTSAIRSQMISSTTGGVLGAKAGTSKEIHGLQRKVVISQDPSSRRMAEMSHDNNTFVRSASLSQAIQRKLDPVHEDGISRQREKLRRTTSVPVPQLRKRDPKPGYCENCQDKFPDFDEHILSRKHRKFAEDDGNWAQLDSLLSQLAREPRY
ncbi:Dfp1/Him1, central region-domain-containing protein [Chaetomium fimeti]|uniref:Dfp1/Him1, central region-domain-containing protein n=1 Tax=Chaetomium fimeti TaxID=1854472 RepID=A0AAE0H9X6_9PEZI|nr:Dfp1/Him1, central region-domain-containing protein [Chaetomium fimeti]